jgi:hypothetical protein
MAKTAVAAGFCAGDAVGGVVGILSCAFGPLTSCDLASSCRPGGALSGGGGMWTTCSVPQATFFFAFGAPVVPCAAHAWGKASLPIAAAWPGMCAAAAAETGVPVPHYVHPPLDLSAGVPLPPLMTGVPVPLHVQPRFALLQARLMLSILCCPPSRR